LQGLYCHFTYSLLQGSTAWCCSCISSCIDN
jgi:hypothetical protein